MVIAIGFVAVTGIALAVNFMNPAAGLGGVLLSLVSIDFGMAAVAVMAWILGRKLWREQHDPRYLGAAIGFASLPVWGVLDSLCVSFVIPAFSFNGVCTLIPGLSWIAVLVLIVVPLSTILMDFRWYLLQAQREAAAVKRTITPR